MHLDSKEMVRNAIMKKEDNIKIVYFLQFNEPIRFCNEIQYATDLSETVTLTTMRRRLIIMECMRLVFI